MENGQIQHPVSGITIAGNLKAMFNNVSAVASDVDLRSNIKVGATLVGEMTIAGEA